MCLAFLLARGDNSFPSTSLFKKGGKISRRLISSFSRGGESSSFWWPSCIAYVFAKEKKKEEMTARCHLEKSFFLEGGEQASPA